MRAMREQIALLSLRSVVLLILDVLSCASNTGALLLGSATFALCQQLPVHVQAHTGPPGTTHQSAFQLVPVKGKEERKTCITYCKVNYTILHYTVLCY